MEIKKFNKLEDALRSFVETNTEMEGKLKKLQKEIKVAGSKMIDEHVNYNRFDEAKETIENINHFNKFVFKTNAVEIEQFAKSIFNIDNDSTPKKPILVEKEGDEFSEQPVDELGGNSLDIQKVKTALIEKDFIIENLNDTVAEISKNGDHYYLTPVLAKSSESELKDILDRTVDKRNIGFICPSEEEMNKAWEVTESWTQENKSECNFLTINFTTLKRIKEDPKVFVDISFE